jgi:hypothetical protein
MTPLSSLLPRLPGFTALSQSYAPWPVWSDSTCKEVRFEPQPKKAMIRLWNRARDFDRSTHQPGRHGGAVGPSALAVLHALVFDFFNFRTGRLDPSYAAISRKANVCERTVATALKRLKELGILNWVRRCAERWQDGRFRLEQETNAYAVLPESQWRGYRAPPEPPVAPLPCTWGESPRMPDVLAQAVLEGDLAGTVHVLASDPTDRLAAVLARFGGAVMAKNG